MKTLLILFLSAIFANATFGADEPGPPSILQPGKDYALSFLDNSRMSMNGPVRVLSHPQNGWVRIEYIPRVAIRAQPDRVRPVPVQPADRPGHPAFRNSAVKRQVWLNLAHIVTIQDWDAMLQEAEQRAAEGAKQ